MIARMPGSRSCDENRYYPSPRMWITDPLTGVEGRILPRRILLALPGRAEIADREKNFFFPVPDQAVECPIPILDRKAAREWHTDRMARGIENKHRKCGHEVIEEPVPRGVMERRPLCMFVPGKTALRDHRAEFFERFATPDRIARLRECARPGHQDEPVVSPEELFTKERADPAAVRLGQAGHLHEETTTDHLEIGKGVPAGFFSEHYEKIALCCCCCKPACHGCDLLFCRGWDDITGSHYGHRPHGSNCGTVWAGTILLC